MNWRRVAGLAAGAGLVAYLLIEPLRAVRDVRDTDFAVFASAGRLVATPAACLYCPEAQRAAASAYLGMPVPSGWTQYFVNPPAAAWVIRPFALLPPSVGMALFALAALVAIAAALVVGVRLLGSLKPGSRLLAIAAVCSLPSAAGIALGQWTPFLSLPLLAAVAWSTRERRPLLAGLLLALLLVKPQLVWLVPVALVIAQRWRMLGGFAIGAALWLSASLIVVAGRAADWISLVAHSGASVAGESLSIPGAAAGVTGIPEASAVATLALALAALFAAWRYRGRLRRDVAATVALAVAASLLLAPHCNPGDLALLAPLLLLWGRRSLAAALTAAFALSGAYIVDSLAGVPGGFHVETVAASLTVIAAAVGVYGTTDLTARHWTRYLSRAEPRPHAEAAASTH
ncbi:MAG: glycosyltransferase family 87 protein [Candidatus Dormibacteria bacterium]